MESDRIKKFLAPQTITVVDAMKRIDENAKGILFILNSQEQLIGVLTDGDIRRYLIKTGDMTAPVDRIMNTNPKVLYQKDICAAKTYMEKYVITALPVITAGKTIIDIILKSEENIPNDKKQFTDSVSVVIMAGGQGTRLYPYTKILPKPLIPIGDIPIMERIINTFKEYGVKEFYATVNYRKNMIKAYFSDTLMNCQLQYVEENKPLGTAGSLRLLRKKFQIPFFVINCDILIQADYWDIYQYHLDNKNKLTVVSALKNITIPYGIIHSSDNGKVLSVEEKPQLSYFINTGMYVLDPELLQEIPECSFYHMTDLINKLLDEGKKVGIYPISEDSFLDMGELGEMRRMEEKLALKSE